MCNLTSSFVINYTKKAEQGLFWYNEIKLEKEKCIQ